MVVVGTRVAASLVRCRFLMVVQTHSAKFTAGFFSPFFPFILLAVSADSQRASGDL